MKQSAAAALLAGGVPEGFEGYEPSTGGTSIVKEYLRAVRPPHRRRHSAAPRLRFYALSPQAPKPSKKQYSVQVDRFYPPPITLIMVMNQRPSV
jgi:hypothetical protein